MPRHILVVEDSRTQAERLQFLLEQEGYSVTVAGNGVEGLASVRAARPDLIISDVLMPQMDGYAFCQALKSRDETRRIPFVFFTERHAPMDIIEGLLRGADNFIPKSSTDAYLLERVNRIFEQLELRKEEQFKVDIVVRVGGRDIPISADKQQIFELLISSVEEAGRASEQLREAQRQLEQHARSLERAVEERTRELSAAEKKYRTLVEQIPAVVYVAPGNVVGRTLYISPQIEAMLGYPVSDWVADPDLWPRLLHPDDRERVLAEFTRLRETGEPVASEYRLLARDGRTVWVRDECSVVPETGLVQGVLLDVTQRRLAEEERTRLSLAVEQAAEAIIVTDTQGTITYVNPAFERATGYTRAEAVGRNPRMLKSGKHDVEFYRTLWSTLLEGQVWHGHFTNKRRDGSHFEEDATIFPVRDGAGKLLNYVAVKRDVTQKRRLEDQLRQAQKLEAIGRLAGGVAHDFNNLLGVITGYSELLIQHASLDQKARRRAEQIQKAAERAAALTRQLLAFSRKQTLEPRVVDLNAVVADVEKMLRRLIGEDIQFSTVLRQDLGRVRVDPGQMEQVIMNLAVNARDAMPRGGKLVIETSNVVLDEGYARTHADVVPGPHVMLAVSDTGHGMDAKTLAHIFEPFFTTKEEGKGTGLGLATVYGIVKQSGGHVTVYSEPGRGSTFKVYLPRVPAAEPEARHTEKPKAPPAGSETILLVEDAEALRAMIREILESAGYKVLEGGSPEEALSLARESASPVHLLLTDVVMPKMSGADLAAQILALRPRARVLYISGYTNDAIGQHGLLEPGTHFLEKPFTADALLHKVREVLDEA